MDKSANVYASGRIKNVKEVVLLVFVAETSAVTVAVVSDFVLDGVPLNVSVTLLPVVHVNVNPVPDKSVIRIVTLHPDAELAVN